MKRALGVTLLLASACDNGFPPETLVDSLRVLSVRSTPADLVPGESASLEGLVLDPSRPDAGTAVLWLGCEPDPYNQNRSACSDPALLQDPGSFTPQGADGGLPAGMSLLGFGAKATLTTPKTLFDVFPQGDPRRVSGTVAQVLAFAVAAEVKPTATRAELDDLFARVKSKEVPSLITLFRLHVSESPERNTNPIFQHLLVDGAAWPDGAHLVVEAQQQLTLDVEAPDAAFEPYTNVTPDGVEQKTERLMAAWFSTGGRFTEPRTALREGVKTVFTSPGGKGDPVPGTREGSLWIVLRDTRGGQAWQQVPFVVCAKGLPTPNVTDVRAPSNPAFPVAIDGQHLEYLVDVLVGETALVGGGLNAATGFWEGKLPPLPKGTYPVDFLSRSCGRHSTGLSITVP